MVRHSRGPLKNLKLPRTAGIYFLVIHLDRTREIVIGKRGSMHFRKGHYIYVGSAMNGLHGRIERHMAEDKKIHWHVDYLLQYGEVKETYVLTTTRRIECEGAGHLSTFLLTMKGFGSSDCSCSGHLFHSLTLKEARASIISFSKLIMRIL